MTKTFVCNIIILWTIKQFLTPPDQCASPWRLLPHGCYLFLTESIDWYHANKTCEDMNAHLVKIETEEENEELFNETINLNITDPYAWIGLTDLAVTEEWVWTDGEPAEFTNWAPGEPNNPTREHCGHMFLTSFVDPSRTSKWNNRPCDLTQSAICERNIMLKDIDINIGS